MNNNNIFINEHEIGIDKPPFIIAEMSGNHNQLLENALKVIDAAVAAGAHAIKLQTYTADTMTLDINENEFQIRDDNNIWNGNYLYSLYEKAHTPWDWHKKIFSYAKEKGITCFSTPFDESAVDFLESLNVPAYKIASFENIDIPLIKKVASKKKPMIISTGMASLSEIELAVATARNQGCKDIILLKCTSSYPSSPKSANLRTIPYLRNIFNCQIGLSDHTYGIGTAIASVAFGATVIEKHLTLDRDDGAVDSAFSIEPDELRSLVIESKRAQESIGEVKFGPSKEEIDSLKFRRSIYISKNISKGEVLSKDNIRIIRPGLGIKPKNFEKVLGRKIRIDCSKGTPLSWDIID